jgi:hypothetical protein
MMNIRPGDKITLEVEKVEEAGTAGHLQLYFKGRRWPGDWNVICLNSIVHHEIDGRNIQIGDTVKLRNAVPSMKKYTVLAIDGDSAWLKGIQTGGRFTDTLSYYERVD